MNYICQYCGKTYNYMSVLKRHINRCPKNPNIINEITCQYCGNIFKSIGGKKYHELTCSLNPNKIVRTLTQKYDLMTDNELLIELKKYKARKDAPTSLITVCKNRNIKYEWTSIYTKYHFFTDDMLINELKNYKTKKDIPYGIKIELKKRNIKLPERFNINPNRKYNKDLALKTSEELLNDINLYNDAYEVKENGLYNIILELKKRSELPEKYNQNLTISKYHYYTDEQILEILNNFNSKSELRKNGYSTLIKEINCRKIKNLPNWFNKTNFTEWHYKTNNELLDIIKIYNNRNELKNNGLDNIVKELKKRNILPQRFTKKYHPEYENMTDEELINLAKNEFKNSNIRDSLKINRSLINNLRKRNIIYEVFTYRKTEINEYTVESFIKKANILYNNKYDYSLVPEDFKNWKSNIRIICPIHDIFSSTPLRHLSNKNDGCPYCSRQIQYKNQFKNYYTNKEKLNLLTEYDLLSMDWAVILDLIGEDKLPNEFQKLSKYGANTPARKEMIEELINTYNINAENNTEQTNENDDINDSIEKEVNEINETKTSSNNFEEDTNQELKTYKELQDYGKSLENDDEKIFSTGDKWLHIIRKEMNKLWNLILRDNEKNNTKNLNIIKSKLNENITKFEKYVYEEFLKEYNEVINLEIH